jgi:hypothetical protein
VIYLGRRARPGRSGTKEKLDRLPAAYRHGEDGLVETEPAGGGFYAGPPPFDRSHGELVSTVADFHHFTRMLVDGTGATRGVPARPSYD